MKIKEYGTYAGQWYEIVEPFSESDFDIEKRGAPKKNQGITKSSFSEDSWKTRIEAGVTLTMREDTLTALESIGSYHIIRYVERLKQSMYNRAGIELRRFVGKSISYKGIKLEASKLQRFGESVDALKVKYDSQKLIDGLIDELNEDFTRVCNSSNDTVLNDNIKRTNSQDWKDYVDDEGGLTDLAKEIDGLAEKLTALKKELHERRNDAMLKLFEEKIEWGATDEDNNRVKLPQKVIDAFRENLKNHEGFKSFKFGDFE